MKNQIIKLLILTSGVLPLAQAQIPEVEIQIIPPEEVSGEANFDKAERPLDDNLSLAHWCSVQVTTEEFDPHVCILHNLTGFISASGSNKSRAKINLCKKVRQMGLNTKVKNFTCTREM